LADIAREATRGDRTQWAAARHLTRFVDQAIASAPPELDEHDPATTWKRRKGGCVGHAAVFAALARTLGLRVRTAYGVLLEDGELQAHAWSEVEIDGRFYAVDPSRGSAPVGPDHLALARDDEPDPLRAGRCLLALPQMKWTVVPRTAAGK
jgi:transglutaminase-like putative cysteine protease